MQVIDKILARYIRRNREKVLSYKNLERAILRLHQTIGDRKGRLLYVKNHKFSKNFRNFFLRNWRIVKTDIHSKLPASSINCKYFNKRHYKKRYKFS